ncbi:MAG: hypothetical protein EOM04_07635 [Clostridia bacterium]|nr:hypothetical protein [Clostridia bacterium]
MSTKKIVILSVFFVITGFFLTGYVFADEEVVRQGSGDIESLKEEQKLLLEKIAELEERINPVAPTVPEPQSEDPVEPVKDKVLVAYVKDEYNAVNTRADAGTNYPVVERIPQKSPMVVLETKDDWYRVKLESGNIAWVASWVVRVQEE